MKMRYCI